MTTTRRRPSQRAVAPPELRADPPTEAPSATTAAPSGARHGHDPGRHPEAGRPIDPIAMQDLGSYGIVAQCFEFLCTLGDEGTIAPGLAESWEPDATGSVWTFHLRQGVKWHDGTDFTSADVAATLDRLLRRRQRWPQGRDRAGLGGRQRSRDRGCHAALTERQLPVPGVGVRRPGGHHAGGLHHGYDARRVPERHRTMEADQVRCRHRRRVRPQRRLVGRRSAACHDDVPVLRRRRVDGNGPRPPARSTRWSSSRSSAARRCSTTPTSTSSASRRHAPPDLDALRHGSVHRQAGPSGARVQHRPPGCWSTPCSRARRRSPTTT